eukprot:1727913-Pyramimonas_sp.AAC.1
MEQRVAGGERRHVVVLRYNVEVRLRGGVPPVLVAIQPVGPLGQVGLPAHRELPGPHVEPVQHHHRGGQRVFPRARPAAGSP